MYSAQEKLLSLLQDDREAIVREPGWYRQLLAAISDLLDHDFTALVNLLYRVDVSEEKLKLLLKDNPGTDAAEIISHLIVERQLQKIKNRQAFSFPAPDIGDNEKW